MVGSFARELIVHGNDRNHDAVARFDFFDVRHAFFIAGHRFGIGFIASGQHDDGKIFVDKRVRSVLHFAGGITFGMDVRNFFELQGPFERDGIMDAAAQVKEIRVAKKLPRKIFIEAGRIGLQNGFDFVGDTQRFLHEVSGGRIAHFSTRLAEIRRE